ncbi:helix-turn-helix domain-containing protein [Streptomyces sp. NBC_01476]|uniref:helix-turn-helix domain-containing protein n=1 Tax=Streptomyces sp. NBC_01476 TaxID=2903881 RepID=UPI002E311D46|nr:helix-turn-helix transcriptional regulator [Streptomyces sp. NBC_01476]
MSGNWTRLGIAVRDARETRSLTQAELGDLVGVGATTIANIERARVKKISPTLRAIAREFGWGAGSIEGILAGGDPLPATPGHLNAPVVQPDADPPAVIGTEGLGLRVVEALAAGTTLDSTVIPLGPNGEMVVIVKGKPTASRAQLRAELEAWEQREGHLRRLGLTPADPATDDPSDNG